MTAYNAAEVTAGVAKGRSVWHRSKRRRAHGSRTTRRQTRPDYDRPAYGAAFYIRTLLEGCAIASAVDLLFYRSWLVLIMLLPMPVIWTFYRVRA